MGSKYIPKSKTHKSQTWEWSSKPFSKEERERIDSENKEYNNTMESEKTRIESIDLDKLSFKDLYQFPFHQAKYGSWVYDKNSNFIFQFELGGEDVRNTIISILNNELSEYNRKEVRQNEGYIQVKIEETWHNLLLIRGWGNLTGAGAYNLKAEYACKIQDTLAEFIVEKLSK